jgi:uncharacterized protein (DUF1501 family)
MKQPEGRSRRSFLKTGSMLGLAVAFSPGMIGEAFIDSKSKTTKKGERHDTNQGYTTSQRAGC